MLFKTFKSQLQGSFLALCTLFSIAIVISIYINTQTNRHLLLMKYLHQLEVTFKVLVNYEAQFLINDVKTDELYFKKSSASLQERKDLLAKTKNLLENIKTEFPEANYQGLSDTLSLLLTEHNQNFLDIVSLILKKGFNDYGLEGKMRGYIHKLEDNWTDESVILEKEILMLRRHEKDFLLRGRKIYIQKHQLLVELLKTRLENRSEKKAAQERHLLNGYSSVFSRLADLKLQLGSFQTGGLLQNFKKSTEKFSENTQQILNYTLAKQSNDLQFVKTTSYSVILFSAFMGFLFSFYFARSRAKPMGKLLDLVKASPQRGKKAFDQKIEGQSYELAQLHIAFKDVFTQLQHQIDQAEKNQKTMEAQNRSLTQVNKELDHFVYSVSHDLRAPLTSVMGLLSLLQDEKDLQKIDHYREMMLKSVERLDSFIKDILDYSRNSRLEVESNDVDLKELTLEIFESLRFMDPGHLIVKEVICQENCQVVSDERRLKIILSNLISNSLKYTQSDAPEPPYVKVYISRNHKSFLMRIEDNGVGVEEDKQSKIFNMFYRATHLSKGSGLGLYIVKETVNILQGQIRFESTFGKGSQFEIRLPHSQKKEGPNNDTNFS